MLRRPIALALAGALLATSIAAVPARSATTSSFQAPVRKWAYGVCFTSWCQTGWYSSPAVADIDGDNQPDVVWGSYDVVALSGATGSLKWRAANGQRVWPGVAVTDQTGNGTVE